MALTSWLHHALWSPKYACVLQARALQACTSALVHWTAAGSEAVCTPAGQARLLQKCVLQAHLLLVRTCSRGTSCKGLLSHSRMAAPDQVSWVDAQLQGQVQAVCDCSQAGLCQRELLRHCCLLLDVCHAQQGSQRQWRSTRHLQHSSAWHDLAACTLDLVQHMKPQMRQLKECITSSTEDCYWV